MSKNKWWYLLVAFSSIHLFFVNIKDTHDWGDDFAQYIHQAKNIVEGIPQTETGYLFNDHYSMLGPVCYPPGFSLLLAPVYVLQGVDIKSFSYLISGFLFLTFILSFILFQNYFKSLTSWVLVLVMAFNPWIINFKLEVNSDIPFTFFILSSLMWYKYRSSRWVHGIILGLLTGFVVSLRTIGFALVVAFIIDQLFVFLKKREGRAFSIEFFGSFFITLIIFYLLLNKVIFNMPSLAFYSTSSSFFTSNYPETIFRNLTYYEELIKSFLMVSAQNQYFFITIFLSCSFLFLVALGLVVQVKSGIGITELFFVIYFVILIVYPYSSSGYRFLLPVTPLLIVYAATAIRFIFMALQFKWKHIYIALFAFLLYLNYKTDWETIIESQDRIINGPFQSDSKETFRQVRNLIRNDERILFIKPRALALFTDRSCFANNPDENSDEIADHLKEKKISYILINDEISDKAIKDFVVERDSIMSKVWSNSIYHLYKIKI